MDHKFAVIVPTYFRGPDIFFVLKRCLDSIFSQSYKQFKIFIIGDDFLEIDLLKNFLNDYDNDKVEFINLPIAVERAKYLNKNKYSLWCAGGANARNFGINYALTKGYSWICAIDHDDTWREHHLEEIKKAIDMFNPDVVFTKAIWDQNLYPNLKSENKYFDLCPIPEQIIHSSVCINFLKVPLRYTDFFEATNKDFPSDAFMWRKMRDFYDEKKIKSVFINEITCNHLEEGYEKK